MSARLFIIGRGATAERLCEFGGALGYGEVRLIDVVPGDVAADDHVIVAEEDARRGQDMLVTAARIEPPPAYLGLAAPYAEGQKALVRLFNEGVPAGRAQHVRAPAGVDVGAETPAEVAIAVAAELVAVRRGRADQGGLVARQVGAGGN
jgi:xanthine dehydrogenase accessory factor